MNLTPLEKRAERKTRNVSLVDLNLVQAQAQAHEPRGAH